MTNLQNAGERANIMHAEELALTISTSHVRNDQVIVTNLFYFSLFFSDKDICPYISNKSLTHKLMDVN